MVSLGGKPNSSASIFSPAEWGHQQHAPAPGPRQSSQERTPWAGSQAGPARDRDHSTSEKQAAAPAPWPVLRPCPSLLSLQTPTPAKFTSKNNSPHMPFPGYLKPALWPKPFLTVTEPPPGGRGAQSGGSSCF